MHALYIQTHKSQSLSEGDRCSGCSITCWRCVFHLALSSLHLVWLTLYFKLLVPLPEARLRASPVKAWGRTAGFVGKNRQPDRQEEYGRRRRRRRRCLLSFRRTSKGRGSIYIHHTQELASTHMTWERGGKRQNGVEEKKTFSGFLLLLLFSQWNACGEEGGKAKSFWDPFLNEVCWFFFSMTKRALILGITQCKNDALKAILKQKTCEGGECLLVQLCVAESWGVDGGPLGFSDMTCVLGSKPCVLNLVRVLCVCVCLSVCCPAETWWRAVEFL